MVGLLRVTHRFHPGIAVDLVLFALGIGAGLCLSQEQYRNTTSTKARPPSTWSPTC